MITGQDLVALLHQVGSRFGTGHKKGVYDRVDPTHYERFKLAVLMEIGFGKPVVAPSEDADPDKCEPWPAQAYPPEPEVAVVEYHDATWGISVLVTTSQHLIRSYFDTQSRSWTSVGVQERDPAHTEMAAYGHKEMSLQDATTLLEQILNRLILEGDWGNDKLPSGEEMEDPIAVEA
jgi:hypothetical protein